MTARVRPARREDVPQIHRLVVELATFEREPDAVRASVPDMQVALFGEHPLAFCLVAEAELAAGSGVSPDAEPDASATLAGFALWYVTYSTWTGKHGIWLEDLYVRPEHRAGGVGRALLGELAAIGVARGYTRLEWSVLDWNVEAQQFYRRLGAHPQDDWTVWRLDDTRGGRLSAAAAAAGRVAESGGPARDQTPSPRPARGTCGDDDVD